MAMVIKRSWNQRDQSEIPPQFYKQHPGMYPRWARYEQSRLNVLMGVGWQVVRMKESDIMTVIDPIKSTINDKRDISEGKKSNKGFSDPMTGGGQVGTVVRNGDLILMMIPIAMIKDRNNSVKNYTDEVSGKNHKKKYSFQDTAENVGRELGQEIPTSVTDVDPNKIRKEVRKYG